MVVPPVNRRCPTARFHRNGLGQCSGRGRVAPAVDIVWSGRRVTARGGANEVHVVKARPAAGGGRWVEISPERMRGWLDGFYGRHDGATESGLVLTGNSNRDTATLYPPPGLEQAADVDSLLTALARPPRLALLLARKGAVAVGIADGTAIVSSKVERFYAQGRTAAGGWSQQRYARRRANQADAATQKAADIAVRVLLPHARGAHPVHRPATGAAGTHAGAGTPSDPNARSGPAAGIGPNAGIARDAGSGSDSSEGSTASGTHASRGNRPTGGGDAGGGGGTAGSTDPGGPVAVLVCGGDRSMIDAVLADPRLEPLAALRHPHLLDCAEPRLAVLEEAAVAARRVRIHLVP